MPARSPARSAITAYLRRCASASDWSGRVEDGARVGHRLVEEQAVEVVAEVVVGLDVAAAAGLRVAPRSGARGSGAPGAAAATSRHGSASASRLSAATRSSAGRSGLDHSPSMYASPAPTSPPSEHPDGGRRVVDVDLAGRRRRAVAEDLARSRPAARRPAARRGSGRAAPSMTRRAAPSSRRPGARPIRRCGDLRCSSLDASACADGRAVAEERGAAQPQAQRVPVDQGDRPVGQQRVADEHPQQRAVGRAGRAGGRGSC